MSRHARAIALDDAAAACLRLLMEMRTFGRMRLYLAVKDLRDREFTIALLEGA